jgi:two-component system, OmpR family, sensor kinase
MGDQGRRGRIPRWSVRSRILTAILLVAAIGLGGAGVTTYLVLRMRILTGVDTQLTSRVEIARTVAKGAGSSSAALQDILSKLIPNAHEGSIGFTPTRDFVPGVSTDLTLSGSAAFKRQVLRDVAGGRVWLGTTTIHGETIRYIAVPISVRANPADVVYVDAVNLDEQLVDLDSAARVYGIVASIALVAIGLVGWFVAGRLLRPIRRLRAAASRITASELRERIPVAGSDDVSELTTTVNDMLDRLDTALTAQRQLLDDVRHELKTPITIVRGHLELLDSSQPREVDATRALALDELDRMSVLVDDIEALAETQRQNLHRRATDVADLTQDVFAKVGVLPGHEWKLTGVAHVSALLDPARITQGWLQLADNAAKYSPEGSGIQIGSREIDGGIELWVADAGPGIPSESLGRIFERFGRADTGRGIRGSGLGLPIVAAIAEAHGGTVSLETSPTGSRFGILLPTQPAQPSDGEASS